MDIDGATDNFVLMMKQYTKDIDLLKKIVRGYVTQKSTNGKFTRIRDLILGNIFWDVTKKY